MFYRWRQKGTDFKKRSALAFEPLESRELLTAINWINEFNLNNGFDNLANGDEEVARQLVNRAINNWESVIIDQDFDNDLNPSTNDVFNIEIAVADLETALSGQFAGSRGAGGPNTFSTGTPGWESGVPNIGGTGI